MECSEAMQTPRVSVVALLSTGVMLASAVATADPPKVSAGPAAPPAVQAAPKLTLQAKTVGAPASLTTEQKATLQKAVKAGVSTWVKTKNPSKAYAAGRSGLSGSIARAYRTSMTAFVSANISSSIAVRYSIEGGNATVTQGNDCLFTIDANLTVKNRIGGPFPADKPAPTLEAVYLPTENAFGPGAEGGSVAASAPVPRLAGGQSATVRLTYSKTLKKLSSNQCAPPTHDLELNFLGVASMGVYVLRMNGTSGGDLETLPLGSTPTNPNGIPDIPVDYPDGCQGWPKCPDGTCMLPNIPCGSY